MKAMTATEAKNAFGTFLDTVQQEPVVVTQDNRPVGLMLSMADVETLFGGDADVVARTLEESRIDKRLALAREEARTGKVVAADGAFFEGLRQHIRSKYGAD